MTRPIFKLEKVQEKIYLLTFDSHYLLAMHFLRYSEYYESHNPKFKNNVFTIVDYMEWYTTQFKKDLDFTYPSDWAGFNFPGKIIKEVRNKGIPDWNRYDHFMNLVYDMIVVLDDSEDFYLIGARADEYATKDHEIAHGFWYLNPKYKEEMFNLIKEIPTDHLGLIRALLTKEGYCGEVLDDETQAYLATGTDWDEEELAGCDIEPYQKKFEEVFHRYVTSKS